MPVLGKIQITHAAVSKSFPEGTTIRDWKLDRHVPPKNQNGYGIFIWRCGERKFVKRLFRADCCHEIPPAENERVQSLVKTHVRNIGVEKPLGALSCVQGADRFFALITEHLDGITLGDLWLKEKCFPWSVDYKEEIFIKMATEIAALHEISGTHKHTHFQNIMFNHGAIVIVDPKYLSFPKDARTLFEDQARDVAWMVSESLHTELLPSFGRAKELLEIVYGDRQPLAKALIQRARLIIQESEECNPVEMRLALASL